MKMIGLLCPAIVSVLIRERNSTQRERFTPYLLFRYGIYVFVNVFLTTAVITFGFRISEVTADAFESFSFFIKYSLIAVILAVLVPFLEEIFLKYFNITWNVRTYDEQEKTSGKNRK